jgi:hypothetical protein
MAWVSDQCRSTNPQDGDSNPGKQGNPLPPRQTEKASAKQLHTVTLGLGKPIMPRFVILEHDHPATHWDFMLEVGTALRTWRLEALPEPGRPVEAVASFDHRAVYLDYEGPVSGNRGTVRRWDSGTFTWVEDTAERVAVMLTGMHLHGLAVLEFSGAEKWSLRFEPEGGAKDPSL